MNLFQGYERKSAKIVPCTRSKIPHRGILIVENEKQVSVLAKSDAKLRKRYVSLRDKKRSADEQKEFHEVQQSFAALYSLETGLLPALMVEKELKPLTERLREELGDEFGNESSLTRVLIDRLVCAWAMSYSYERMFRQMKYRENERGGTSINFEADSTNFLKEVRKDIESANSQIVRLSETLRNLNSPAIQVRATNAFFAQNQQVNQQGAPKDLEKIPAH